MVSDGYVITLLNMVISEGLDINEITLVSTYQLWETLLALVSWHWHCIILRKGDKNGGKGGKLSH